MPTTQLGPAGSGSAGGYRPTLAGLVIALVVPLIYTLVIGPRLLEPRMPPTAYALVGMAVLWACALALLAVVRRGERAPLSSLGFKPITVGAALLAVGIGVALSLLVPLLSTLANLVIPAPAEGGVLDAARNPAWLLLLGVLTAGFTEEVLFRAYPLERLGPAGRFPLVGFLVGLAVFTVIHAGGWNAAHVIGVVLPLGAILALLYLWRRQIWFVIIVHTVIDLPLVVMAAV
ncbi:MAG: CPBP family intramembrane metalloprotease [Actinobacteria bacterium]|nr:CPBP family intramembrane metalloprotease [Actinomycetota bacterium]